MYTHVLPSLILSFTTFSFPSFQSFPLFIPSVCSPAEILGLLTIRCGGAFAEDSAWRQVSCCCCFCISSSLIRRHSSLILSHLLGLQFLHGAIELFLGRQLRSPDDGAKLLIVSESILVEGNDDVALLDFQLFVQGVKGLELSHLLAHAHLLLGVFTKLGQNHDTSDEIGFLVLDFLNLLKGNFAGHYLVVIAHLRGAFINFDTAHNLLGLRLHLG